MRDLMNVILSFIGATSLTDDEFAAASLTATNSYSTETYLALLNVIDNRELVSDTRDRLRYMFLARGISLPEETSTDKSNIFVGASLG
jgi:hypothetical protein